MLLVNKDILIGVLIGVAVIIGSLLLAEFFVVKEKKVEGGQGGSATVGVVTSPGKPGSVGGAGGVGGIVIGPPSLNPLGLPNKDTRAWATGGSSKGGTRESGGEGFIIIEEFYDHDGKRIK